MTLREIIHFHKQLRAARPSLYLIAPLTFSVCAGFVIFNLWIAYAILVQQSLTLVIVGGIFNKFFWELVYTFIGLFIGYGLWKNEWGVIKLGMILGVFIKTLWTYALIQMGLMIGFHNILGTLVLWSFATYVQIVVLIFFSPSGVGHARPTL